MAKLSYKVSYYALYVMFAIILVVFGHVLLRWRCSGRCSVWQALTQKCWQPAHTDALIYLMYILFFVAIIATVVGAFVPNLELH